jgi:hypothetical protein
MPTSAAWHAELKFDAGSDLMTPILDGPGVASTLLAEGVRYGANPLLLDCRYLALIEQTIRPLEDEICTSTWTLETSKC